MNRHQPGSRSQPDCCNLHWCSIFLAWRGKYPWSAHSLFIGCCSQITPILLPVHKCWQPSDLLPQSQDPDFLDKVRARLRCLLSIILCTLCFISAWCARTRMHSGSHICVCVHTAPPSPWISECAQAHLLSIFCLRQPLSRIRNRYSRSCPLFRGAALRIPVSGA